MSRFASKDLMVPVLPENAAELVAGPKGCERDTTGCTNVSDRKRADFSSPDDLALLQEQLTLTQ